MADVSDSLSSSKHLNAEFNNIDINTIKLLKDQSDLVYDGTRIKWMRDFSSLDNFVNNVIGLSGRWKSSGGKAKQFTDLNSDFTITWYPGKLNSLTFNGEKGELFKTFLVSVLNTNCVERTNTDADCLFQTNAEESDQTRSQSGCFSPIQEQPITDGTSKVFIDVDSAHPDRPTLDELQEFIEQAFQNTSVLNRNANINFPYTQTIYSSTPSRPQIDANSGIMEEQFCTFKEKFELEIAILQTKLSDQTRIINENKQDICKLVGENLHLRSRLAELENNVRPRILSNIVSVSKEKSNENTSHDSNPMYPQPDESTKTDQLPVAPSTQVYENSSPADENVNLQTDELSKINLPSGVLPFSSNVDNEKSLIIIGTGERNNTLLPTKDYLLCSNREFSQVKNGLNHPSLCENLDKSEYDAYENRDQYNATSVPSPDLPHLEMMNPQPDRLITEPNTKYTFESFPAFKHPRPSQPSMSQNRTRGQTIKSLENSSSRGSFLKCRYIIPSYRTAHRHRSLEWLVHLNTVSCMTRRQKIVD